MKLEYFVKKCKYIFKIVYLSSRRILNWNQGNNFKQNTKRHLIVHVDNIEFLFIEVKRTGHLFFC